MRPLASVLTMSLTLVLGVTAGCINEVEPFMCLVDFPLARADMYPGTAFHGVVALDESVAVAVAVGDAGLVVRIDADESTRVDAGTDADLRAIVRTSRLLAIGTGGTVLRSTDGAAWTPVDAGVSTDLHDVARTSESYEQNDGGAHLLAIGDDTVLLGELDGASWTPVVGDQAPGPLRKVVATDDGFLAFSATGAVIAIDPSAASFVTLPDILSAAPISLWADYVVVVYLADGTYWSGTPGDAGWRFEPFDPEYPCAGEVRLDNDRDYLCIDEGTLKGIPIALDHFAAIADLGEDHLVVVGDDGSLRVHQRVFMEWCK